MPLVPAAVALVAGIVVGRYAPLTASAWGLIALAGLAAAVGTLLRPHLHLLTAAFVAATVLALGAVRVRLDYFAVSDDHVVTYTGVAPGLATLRGRIVTAPQAWKDPGAAAYRAAPRMSFLMEAHSLRIEENGRVGWRPVEGQVRVSVETADYRLAPGMDVELMGWMSRPRGPANPGGHDWAEHDRRRGVLVRMTVAEAAAVAVRGSEDQPWYVRAYWRLRAGTRQHLAACGDAEGGQLLNALIIGERHPALRRLNEAMVRAGVAHFLSISGLHLGIFVGFVYLVCRACMLGRRRSAGVVLVLLAAYVLLAEPRPPLLRSAIMAASLCVAVFWHRPHSALNALAGAAVILLALAPLQLFAAGFQLSFVIVAGVIVLHEPVHDLLFGRWTRHRGLMVFRNEQRVRRWLQSRAAAWLMNSVTMCLTAFLCAAPLVAWHFGRFSPYAPLLTFVLLPLVLGVLVPGYVSIALAWPMPNLAHLVGTAATGAAGSLRWVVMKASALPGLSFELRPVPALWVVACYAALVLVAFHRRIRFGRAWAGGVCLAIVASTVYTQRTAPPPATAQLDLLAVGSGQCAVLRVPSGPTYLLDAGTIDRTDVGRHTLLPFLRHMRLPAPKAAMISHANTDHYNALPDLVGRGPLSRVYLNDYFGSEADPPREVRGLMETLADHNVEVVRLHAGKTLRLDERTTVEVLWPPAGKPTDLTVNDTSLVLRITCDDVSVLVTGDLDSEGQAGLTETPERIRCDVLVMPHHGGWEKTLPGFVEAADPETVLVSGGREPRGPVRKDNAPRIFYQRLKTTRKYFSTPRNGWIRVHFGRGKTRVQTMR